MNVLHVVFVLDLSVAFRATYPLSSPGVLASRREGGFILLVFLLLLFLYSPLAVGI